ncbi:MAG: 4'-phosphopantetheinyl transferase family protein [Verrucomicrobiota bacterium]
MNPTLEQFQWPTAAPELALGQQDVHVWAAPLNVSPATLAEFFDTLSTNEKERAGRFKFEQHRSRYIAGRGWLRAALGHYLQTSPAELNFHYSVHGKPELTPNSAGGPLHFNLAHSGDVALLGVTRIGPVGVDVEAIREVKDVADLVARFFSERENHLFQQLAMEQRPAAFFNLWTRKEALLKATGEGIVGGLNRVEVSFLADEPARLLALAGDVEQAARWTLTAFSPALGFVGALAIEAQDVRVSTWRARERFGFSDIPERS